MELQHVNNHTIQVSGMVYRNEKKTKKKKWKNAIGLTERHASTLKSVGGGGSGGGGGGGGDRQSPYAAAAAAAVLPALVRVQGLCPYLPPERCFKLDPIIPTDTSIRRTVAAVWRISAKSIVLFFYVVCFYFVVYNPILHPSRYSIRL